MTELEESQNPEQVTIHPQFEFDQNSLKFQGIDLLMGKLTIMEKKLELKRKRNEIKFNELNLSHLKTSYENEQRILQIDEQRVLIDKIAELRNLLGEEVVEEHGNVLGGEPKYKPIIDDDDDRSLIKNKMFELIRRL